MGEWTNLIALLRQESQDSVRGPNRYGPMMRDAANALAALEAENAELKDRVVRVMALMVDGAKQSITELRIENVELRLKLDMAANLADEVAVMRSVAAAASNERDTLREEVGRREKAIRWALGEDPPGTPDFAAEHEMELERRERGELEDAFWWRNTLRRLAALESIDG